MVAVALVVYSSGPSCGCGCGCGDGPSSGRGSGRGSSEGGRRQSKRKNASGESRPSAKKGKMKAQHVVGGDGAEDCGECSDAIGEVLHSFSVPLGPYWNVEFPLGVHSQYGQSDCLETASSTHTLGDDMPAINTNKDNFDSETGHSEHS